ncbi:MAG: xanthine dehydrogenase family protein molybdopterin-binding subunit [Hyphomicrobiaceae bacterium]
MRHTGPTFGKRVERVEDASLLTGRARFVDDIRISGMLEAAYVRSPFPHALVRSIDVTQARALEGVHAVFTMANLRPALTQERIPLALSSKELSGLAQKSLRDDITPPVLALDEVCYVGEPVVLIVADSRYIAEDAVALVAIDYEPLEAVADITSALTAGGPRVHKDIDGNVLAEYVLSYGDYERSAATAAHRFQLDLKQHRGCAHPLEGRGVLAMHDALEQRTTVWSSTQSPHEVRLTLVQLLGLDDEELHVVTPDVGGGFGAKYLTYPEEVSITIAARLLGRPVKWIEDRREHFLTAIQERDQLWQVEIALDAEAKILGIKGDMTHDQGAYTPQGINVSYNSATAVPGPYKVPSYELRVRAVETNKVPTMPVRGAGYPQATFAMERLLDHAAREIGIDRAEIRRRNLIQPEEMPYTTPLKTRAGTPVKYDSGDFPLCQAMALDQIDYDGFEARRADAARDGRLLGVGFANATKGTGRGPFETATVRVARSGRVSVYTGAAAMGQSTATMLAQIVADQLGVEFGQVNVVAGDTRYTSMGHGGFASRQAVNAGSSAHEASVKVREKALLIASQLLEQPVDALELSGGRIWLKGQSNVSLGLGDLAREASGIPGYSLPKGIEPGLEHTANFMPKGLVYSNGCHAVEVEVDRATGAVRLERYVIVSDCGELINPMVVDGQVIGGAVHGIGNALFEWMGYDEMAQPITTTFAEYLLPTTTELPRIELTHLVHRSPLNPLGIKGVGEVGTIPAAAAIISAVEDALRPFGVRIDETPILPPRIVALVNASSTAAGASGLASS